MIEHLRAGRLKYSRARNLAASEYLDVAGGELGCELGRQLWQNLLPTNPMNLSANLLSKIVAQMAHRKRLGCVTGSSQAVA